MTTRATIWRIVRNGWSMPVLVGTAIYISLADSSWGTGFFAGAVACCLALAIVSAWDNREQRRIRAQQDPLDRLMRAVQQYADDPRSPDHAHVELPNGSVMDATLNRETVTGRGIVMMSGREPGT